MLIRSRKVTVLAASIGAPAMLAVVLTLPTIGPNQSSAPTPAGPSSSAGVAGPTAAASPSGVPQRDARPAARRPAAGADQPRDAGSSVAAGGDAAGGRRLADGSAGARGRLTMSPAPKVRIPKGPLGSPAVQRLLDRQVPAGSRQAVLVSGEGETSGQLVALSRWALGPDGWHRSGQAARAHIGAQGWGKERVGDYRTPVGTYTLTAAGGYLPAPKGTELPYDFRPERYLKPGSRFADYVVRINWNVARSDWDHVPADTPSIDWNRGSGIWLHADSRYDTPTAGCVSQPLEGMRRTLKWLDPAANPVIVLAPGPLLVERPW